MITLTNLQEFLDRFLYFEKGIDIAKIELHMANGLMVKGREKVEKIGFGVSASLSLFEKAQRTDCDALVVHHAFSLPPFNRYDLVFQNRIAFLLKHEISLFGYHYLLDAHPEIGHAVSIIKTAGGRPTKPFVLQNAPWGWSGNIDATFQNIVKILKPFFSPRTIVYDFGPENVKKIVVCTGKGAPGSKEMLQLIDNKVDLYITGEVHEWNRELFREAGINFIAGGHYATEVFGVKELMIKARTNFPKVKTVFLDLQNPV